MKAVGWVAAMIGGGVIAFLFFSLGLIGRVDGMPGVQVEPSLAMPTYLSFVSVMMTAVTVVLAALAIGIGVIAAFTFRELKERAEDAALKSAEKKTEEIRTTALSAAQESVNSALADDRLVYLIELSILKMNGRAEISELDENFDPSDNSDR